jgi:hypothetical protein
VAPDVRDAGTAHGDHLAAATSDGKLRVEFRNKDNLREQPEGGFAFITYPPANAPSPQKK